jgi:hypothetical protein
MVCTLGQTKEKNHDQNLIGIRKGCMLEALLVDSDASIFNTLRISFNKKAISQLPFSSLFIVKSVFTGLRTHSFETNSRVRHQLLSK